MGVKKNATTGNWAATIRVGGKERQRTFEKKADATAWYEKQRTLLREHQWIDPAGPRRSFKDYAEEWRKAQAHADRTTVSVESNLRVHAYPTFGARAIGSIRPLEIQTWVNGLDLAWTSRLLAYHCVAGVFRSAVANRLIPVSPCQMKFPAAATAAVPPEPLSKEQVDGLVRVCAETPRRGRQAELFRLGADTGCRISELGGLSIDRCHLDDVDEAWLLIDRQLASVSYGAPTFGPPKSPKSGWRKVPLTPRAARDLIAHVDEFGLGTRGLIFSTSSRGAFWRGDATTLWHRVSSLLPDSLVLPEWAKGFHQLRHYYASTLIRENCSVVEVQKVLGHERPSITLDTYSHWWNDSIDDVRAALVRAEREERKSRLTLIS